MSKKVSCFFAPEMDESTAQALVYWEDRFEFCLDKDLHMLLFMLPLKIINQERFYEVVKHNPVERCEARNALKFLAQVLRKAKKERENRDFHDLAVKK